VEYRSRTLNRRRAIAALDAQKAKLLDEIEIDGCEGLLAASYSRTSAATGPSPHITSEESARVGFVVKSDLVPLRENTGPSLYTTSVGLKRSHTEFRESRVDGRAENQLALPALVPPA
jgi:hypothetical protein